MSRRISVFTLIVILGSLLASSESATAAESALKPESKAARDARMKWWREARFGMFIHWGLYAVPAGTWKGRDLPGIGEWIMDSANIPVTEYEQLAKQFNPVKYDPAEWVRTAKEAGIKYIVITSKHHDGFSLFDSKASPYNVAKATPYGKDLLVPLSKECRKQGIQFCVYYSIMDWHHPAQYRGNDQHYNPTKIHPEQKADYMAFMKQQLKELLDTCDPQVLWFDGEWPDWYTEADGREVYTYLRKLKPKLIINNRVGKGRKGMEGLSKADQVYAGDFGTPEQQIPATGLTGVDWESCMTMNDTWGFKSKDQNWKTSETLICNIIDTASKGGNYLLNVGPTAEGLIPGPSVERLRDIGQWMKVNAESVYGTQASPLEKIAWGRCTQKQITGGNTRLYLHVFNWPKDNKLVLSGLENQPVKAFLLKDGQKLEFTAQDHQVAITLPAQPVDKIASVIALDIKGPPKIYKPNPYADETLAQRDARMKWWREARFGMFIHWGVYSVPAGTYKGKQINGIGEWIMNNAKIPCAEYQLFAKEFNPVKYNPDEWVKLAKEAGMKYIVITSKHHDGFALFDSKASDWNVVKASPYGKDLLKPLAAACKKYGIKLGFYYSQAQDWNNPGGASYGAHWDKAQDGSMDDYIRKVAAPQVREILTQYGPIAVLWWDTPANMNKERAEMLLPILGLQPGIIMNNRLGGGYQGDTDTPEQTIPATGMPGRDWETCMTMNDTWGFKSYDNNWKSTQVLIRNLVDIASKGGNYLLNIGPTSEGLFPAPSVERLKAVGQWMKANGEAIYATTASPFKRLPWGRCTTKLDANGATLYLHVFNWPANGSLLVPGLKNSAEKAYLLSDSSRKPLLTQSSDDGLTITLPGTAPDPISSTIVMRVKGKLDITQPVLTQAANGSITLPSSEAMLHGSQIQYESGNNHDNIGYWLNSSEWVEWQFQVNKPGKFKVIAQIAATGSGSFQVILGSQKLAGKAPNTGDYAKYQTLDLGVLEIGAPGKTSLSVKPVREGWQPMNLKSIQFLPSP